MPEDDKPGRRKAAAAEIATRSKGEILELAGKVAAAFHTLIADLGISGELVAARTKIDEAVHHLHRHLSIVPAAAPAEDAAAPDAEAE